MQIPRVALTHDFDPSPEGHVPRVLAGSAVIVQEQNASMPRLRSECDSRSPLCFRRSSPPIPTRPRAHLAVILGGGRVSYARPRQFDSVRSD